MNIDLIVAGVQPPTPLPFPCPQDVSTDIGGLRVIRIEKLIELKLSAGTLPARLRDLADAQDLIRALHLPRELGEKVDSSVRDEYYRIWENSQNVWDPSAE